MRREMKRQATQILLIGLLTLFLFGGMNGAGNKGINSPQQPAGSEAVNKMACLSEGEVLRTLQTMTEASGQRERRQARNTILEFGGSRKCRALTISSLMKFMDRPNAVFQGNPPMFNMWRAGAELLGDLKS